MTKTINTLNQSVDKYTYNGAFTKALGIYSVEEARIQAAIKRYQQGGASVAGAANMFGLDRFDFEKILFERNIPIRQITIEDVRSEVEMLEQILGMQHAYNSRYGTAYLACSHR